MTYISPTKAYAHLPRLLAWDDAREPEKPGPVTLEWDLTERCYLGCQSCHFAHTHTKGPWASREGRVQPEGWEGVGDMADPVLVKQALTDAKATGVAGIVWTGGGEPTLHPEWMELVTFSKGLELRNGMYTAGGLLPSQGEDAAFTLARACDWVVVSLDCANAETYHKEKGVDQFDDACVGIKMLADTWQTVVGVSFLIHRWNYMQVETMYRLAKQLGATYVTFRPTIETDPADMATINRPRDWIEAALEYLMPVAAREDVECDLSRFEAYQRWEGRPYHACYGIRLNGTVTADGRVWVCPNRRGLPDSCLGDLREESFDVIWQRHPGQWTDFRACRAMCRLHMVNAALAPVLDPPTTHTEFI